MENAKTEMWLGQLVIAVLATEVCDKCAVCAFERDDCDDVPCTIYGREDGKSVYYVPADGVSADFKRSNAIANTQSMIDHLEEQLLQARATLKALQEK